MQEFSDYSLLAHNTFGIDAYCRRYVEVSSVDETQSFLPSIADECFLIIGGGSNLLFTHNFDGTVVRSAIRGIEVMRDGHDVLLRCGSGEIWDDVVDYAVSNGYYGAENLSLIPGDVGATAIQNIGAYGSEVKDIIQRVEAVEIATGRKVEFSSAECQYSYRQSRFKGEWKNRYFITYVTYRLSLAFEPQLGYGNIVKALEEKGITTPTPLQLRQAIIDIRNAKLPDPKVVGNAGSFFMNPIVKREKFDSLLALYPSMPHYSVDAEHEKIPAGWLIDQCGWKGKNLGRAGVHDKQALVLVNRGGATGEEIVNLCKVIQNDVLVKFGIEIHPEVNFI